MDFLRIERVNAAFREDQVLIGKGFVNQPDVIEHRLAAAPGLIPVITNTPHKLRRLWISQDGAGSLVDEIAIMIPGNDLLVSQACSLECWAKIISENVAFLLSRINTRFPFLRSHRLVLNRNTPDRYSFTLVRVNELWVIVGPRLVKLRL